MALDSAEPHTIWKVLFIEGDNKIAMAGNGGLQNQIGIGIGGYGSPKEIQAMQSSLSTDWVYSVVNIFLGKTKLKAVTLGTASYSSTTAIT